MPTWRVVIDPQAEAEARASFRWYLARSATAATGFQVALKEAIDSLAEAPYRWPEVRELRPSQVLHRSHVRSLPSGDRKYELLAGIEEGGRVAVSVRLSRKMIAEFAVN